MSSSYPLSSAPARIVFSCDRLVLHEHSSEFSLQLANWVVDLTAEQVIAVSAAMLQAVSYSMSDGQVLKATDALVAQLTQWREDSL